MENTLKENIRSRIEKLEIENKALKGELFLLQKKFIEAEEELLTRSEFKEIIDSISEAIYIQDKDGYFLDVNRSAGLLYGHSREYFMGKTPAFLSAPGMNDIESIKKYVKKAYYGKPQRFEFWGIDKNGNVFPKEVSLTPGKYHGQRAVIAVSRDISDNYLAKSELQERERMYNTLISNLPGMVYRCINDESWTMEYVSPGVKNITGYEPGDLIKNKNISYNEIIHEDDRQKVKEAVKKALQNQTKFTIIYRIKDTGGNYKWVWEQGQGLYDSNNIPVLLEGFITDITEQKKQKTKIEEQSAKINAILKTMPDLFFVFDRDGNYIDVLANNHSKLVLPPDKLIGSNLNNIFPAAEADRFRESFGKCLDTGELQTLEYKLTINGMPMSFEARVSPIDKDHVLAIVRDVTERKKNEEELRQAKENFHHSLNESPLGMRIVSKNYKTVYVNRAMLDIYGYDSIEELKKTPVKKRYTKDSYEAFLARNKLRKQGHFGPEEYEVSIVRKNEETRHLIIYRKEILWNGEKQSLVINRDITQQKLTEKALKESEERFRSIYQNSSLGLYRATPQGKIILANQALVKMLGYKSFNELAERNLLQKQYFSKNTARNEFIKLIAEKKEIIGHETEWKHKNGSIVFVRESVKAVKGKNGDILYYDGVVENITRAKLALKAMHESEEKFRMLVENAFSGIYLLHDRHYEYVNDKFCEITGYSREELTSKDFDFGVMTTEKGKDIVEKWYKERRKGVKKPAVYETQIITKTGELKALELMTIGVEMSGESKVLGVTRDITERQQSQKLKEEVTIAKRSLEFKKNFLANMSHEIRTPLTGIMGMAEILGKTNLTPYQREYLNSLRYSTENLREIIDQILDYSKIEAGEVLLKPRIFSIKSLFENVEKLFESICNKDIELETKICPDLPEYIKTDEQRVLQIIYNLLSNAVKFTDKGKISLRIRSETPIDTKGNFLVKMEVEDTGIGIKPEVQKHLFKPFSQIDQGDTRDIDGTGLGLSICKGLCEILGGKIGVKSRTNKGSLFWFTYKAKRAEETAEHVPGSNGKKASRYPQSLNILHVEDKPVNQKVLALILESMGHNVITANNGKKALEICAKNKFDLILMDIQMPVMDGITATKKLRKKFAELPPIIGLSANAFEGDREKYIKLGMDEYLTKPVNEKDLNELIQNFYPK